MTIAGSFAACGARTELTADSAAIAEDPPVDPPPTRDAAVVDASRDATADTRDDAPSDAPHPVVTALTAGDDFTCGLLSDGRVACWGSGASPACPADWPFASSIPVIVPGLANVTAIAADACGVCTLIADGSVRCAGASSLLPTPFTAWSAPVAAFAVNSPRCVVLTTGAVECLGVAGVYTAALPAVASAAQGAGMNAQCGIAASGGVVCSTPPSGPPLVAPASLSGVVAIAGQSSHANWFGLGADGSVFVWELDAHGADGVRTYTGAGLRALSGTPVTFASLVGGIGEGFLGVTTGGSLAGVRGGPQIGAFSGVVWTELDVGVTDARAVVAGDRHGCALRANGTVSCWGCDDLGQLGDGARLDAGAGSCDNQSGPAVPVTVVW